MLLYCQWPPVFPSLLYYLCSTWLCCVVFCTCSCEAGNFFPRFSGQSCNCITYTLCILQLPYMIKGQNVFFRSLNRLKLSNPMSSSWFRGQLQVHVKQASQMKPWRLWECLITSIGISVSVSNFYLVLLQDCIFIRWEHCSRIKTLVTGTIP